MNGFMFMMRKRKEGILDREPYATFLKKYNKLGDNIINPKIKWKIIYQRSRKEMRNKCTN